MNSLVMKIISGVLALWGVFATLGGLSMLGGESQTPMLTLLLMVVAGGVLPFGLGVFLFRRAMKKARTEKKLAFLEELLDLARRNEGKLTVLEIHRATGLDEDRIGERMQDLQLKGYAELELTDSGTMVYNLQPALKQGDNKQTAKNIFS